MVGKVVVLIFDIRGRRGRGEWNPHPDPLPWKVEGNVGSDEGSGDA